MQDGYLLPTKAAQELYQQIKDLPVYDFHCHLSPKEIWEDAVFTNIGELWLSGDHYKWRLMRAYGIPERDITGEASWRDKFLAYAETIGNAAGNPLYHWTQMELSRYFGIETPLNRDTAAKIWGQANRVITEQQLSPRKLIQQSKVQYIATTDDIADDLCYHQKLQEDSTFEVIVAPSFRTDNLLLITRTDYPAYIKKLSQAAGLPVTDMDSLKAAVQQRLTVFSQAGCRFSDIGIPYFPSHVSTEKEADRTFQKALAGEAVTEEAYSGFLGYMYVFLGQEYKKHDMVMQWHLAVQRNVNTALFRQNGPDSGGDCIGDVIPGRHICRMLDAMQQAGGLPKTILYTLNPAMTDQLCTIAGSFPGVSMGAAWWFCDHKQGILDMLEKIAYTGHIGRFYGMVTDSRSFLSYARHDYFRRILCALLGEWQQCGEFSGAGKAIAEAICYKNSKEVIGGDSL